jgi:hypothetical protein
VNVLANLYEENREAGILTHRHLLIMSDSRILNDIAKYAFADGRLFGVNSFLESVQDIIAKEEVCIHAQGFDLGYNFTNVYLTHSDSLEL